MPLPRGSNPRPRSSTGRYLALGIFALLVTAAPLAFGAVDRISQIALLGVLALGLLVQPPALKHLSRWANLLAVLGVAVAIGKEFAPADWFGATQWRTLLTESFGMRFPWTHHPEPARALDALLAGAVAIVWLLWVRTLAAERENRPILAWSLFGAAAVTAAVSFATRGIDPQAIYGLRYTQGWTGLARFRIAITPPASSRWARSLAAAARPGRGCGKTIARSESRSRSSC
jgi:hypothetical protein